jgi:hypothetical protein
MDMAIMVIMVGIITTIMATTMVAIMVHHGIPVANDDLEQEIRVD